MPLSRANRRGLQIAVSLALYAIFLYLALRGEDWAAIRAELRNTRYVYLLAMAVLGTYIMYARCQRWRVLIAAAVGSPPAIGPLFSATAIGFMANRHDDAAGGVVGDGGVYGAGAGEGEGGG